MSAPAAARDGLRQSACTLSPGQRLVFIGGLHRSGTTLLARCLAAHPEATGLTDTGAIEDEGQYLQSVYPTGKAFGGPGRFAFAPGMHLSEDSPLVTAANRDALLSAWARHWDTDAPVLIEKSPPNLLKTRFLQAMFPGSRFVIVLRHPVATSLATKKWSRRPLSSLIGHWLFANETMLADLPHLQHVTTVRYEDLMSDGAGELRRLHRFLGLEPRPCPLRPIEGLNDVYLARWRRLKRSPARGYAAAISSRFEARARSFGYSLDSPTPLQECQLVP